jgi:hypothetical protein
VIPYSHSLNTLHIRPKSLPQEITKDDSLMQYAIKGSDEQWNKALDGKDVSGSGSVQISSVREKRKGVDTEDFEREASTEQKLKKTKTGGKKNKKGRR